MKRIKFLLPLLAVILMMCTPLSVKAAEQKLPAGTKKATITITLKDLLSCEGVVTAVDNSGKEIAYSNVTASCDKSVMCSTSGNRVFMVSSGEATTLTVTVDITVAADGTYHVYFDGGKTTADGKYTDYSESKEYLESIKLVIGDGSAAEDTKKEENKTDNKDDNKGSSSASGSSGSSGSSSSSKDKDNNKDENKDDKVDYTQLEQALKDADHVISDNSEIKDLINDRNEAIALLTSENQDEIDEAADKLQKTLSKMDKDGTENGFKDLGKVLLIAIPILILAIIICTLLVLRRRARMKGRTNDYEGAPMVDYDIGDDD